MTILLGKGREILAAPRRELEARLADTPARCEERLRFMSEEHHRVRYFVVRELPRFGAPIEPDLIARRLDLQPQRVGEILDELEKRLFFLVRNRRGAVSWAFPVTAEPTPHHMAFNTGERLYGA